MLQVQATEAGEKSPELLNSVEISDFATITRKGEDVAFLVQTCDHDHTERLVAVEAFSEMRAEDGWIDARVDEILEWRREGLR